jgi:antitoxin CcdA
VNLTINADLLARARGQNINLSATLEAALVDQLRKAEREHWLKNNKNAIAAYNEEVSIHGTFSDGLRNF